MNYDVIIIGKGPAGLSCAIYTSRANLRTLVLGMEHYLVKTPVIENYFGFEKISGRELLEKGEAQAKKFGAEIKKEEVLSIKFDGKKFIVKTKKGEYSSRALVLCTGRPMKKLGIEAEEKFMGKGVHYCVHCDGPFYKGKKIIVIGSGDFAASMALELLDFTTDITIYTNSERATISNKLEAELEEKRIKVENKKIERIIGREKLEKIKTTESEEPVDAIFIALGCANCADFAITLGIIVENNFINVDKEMKTNFPGVFAAGDCTGGLAQISTAVGEGAIAGTSVIRFLRS